MKIAIVQISDIHNKNTNIFKKVEELKKVISAHYLSHCDSAILIMNGDMAFSGKSEEYSESELQLIEIKDAIESKVNRVCDIYSVPGNHDCNFNRDTRGRAALIEKIQQRSIEIDDQLITEVTLQEEYNAFEDTFNNDWQYSILNKNNSLAKNISHLNSDGDIVININSLNTAWISELSERPGKMIIPCTYVDDILSYDSNCLNITVMHHPSNWLNPDNKREFDDLIRKNTDVLLTGHEHGNEEYKLESRKSGLYVFEGGVLNEEGDSDTSSFRILIYDSDKKELSATDFHWNSSEQLYTEKGDKRRYPILVKKDVEEYSVSKSFNFRENHSSYLNSIGDPFSHPVKGPLSLDDIFVWPNFKNKKLGSDKFLNVSGETLKKRLIDKNPSYWLIYSPRKHGKTSLAKVLNQFLYQSGFIPILKSGKNIKQRHINGLEKFLKEVINNQFVGLSWDRFIQRESRDKYLIIDNWDYLEVNGAGKEKLIENLQDFFGHIIILTSDSTVSLEEVFQANEQVIKGMEEFRIKEVSITNQEKFVENWVNIENDFNTEKEEITLRVEEYTKALDSVFRTATVPRVPIYINIILQALAHNQTYDFKSKGSGYFYEVLIKQTLLDIQTNESAISTLDTYLSELSFKMFTLRKGVSYDEWSDFHNIHLNNYDMRPQDFKFEIIKGELLGHEVLSLTDNLYHFNHDYLYYFFIAQYIVDNIDDDDVIQETFNGIVRDIDNEENANILWFVTHFKRNNYIINVLKQAALGLLKDTTRMSLDDDIMVFNELMQNVPHLVYEEASVKENRRNRNEIRDKVQDDYDAEREEYTSKKEKEDIEDYRQSIEVVEYVKARKLSEALGNILKNYSGSLKKEVKEELAHITLNLSLKAHAELISRFSSNTEHLVNLFSEMLLQKGKMTKEDSIKKSKEFVFAFVNALCFGLIKNSVNEISTKNLLNAFERIINNSESPTSLFLISYGVFLDNQIFDDRTISSMRQKYKELSNNKVARFTLRYLVIEQLLYFEMPPAKKQKVCQIFDIDYRAAIKEQQRAAINNN